MFVTRLMHSKRDFAWLYPRQDQGCFLDGHVRAFAHFKESWRYETFLYEVLSAEAGSRSESAVRQRIRWARFPQTKTLGDFDFDTVKGIEPAQIAELAKGDWIGRSENLIFAGPVGTGQTHLAIALGLEAAKQRRRVAFYRAADLVPMLLEAHDQRAVGRLHRRVNEPSWSSLTRLTLCPSTQAISRLQVRIN